MFNCPKGVSTSTHIYYHKVLTQLFLITTCVGVSFVLTVFSPPLLSKDSVPHPSQTPLQNGRKFLSVQPHYKMH